MTPYSYPQPKGMMTKDPTPGSQGETKGRFHIFQNGENLIEIAVSYGVSLEDFLKLNNLTEQSMLFPGQKLKIPVNIEHFKEPENPTSHIVKVGETLTSIAERYRLSATELQKFNNLTGNAMVFPGTVLRLSAETKQVRSSLENPPVHCLIHGYHKVKAGDQVSRIAAFHGVSTQALLSANGLSWNALVTPGSKLVIPISHGALDCPNLVQLSETASAIANTLVESARKIDLPEFSIIIALCLEMQRSGLLPDLGIRQQTEKLLTELALVAEPAKLGVRLTLEQVGYIELAEGAAKWEPSAWLWLHQIGSKSV